MSKERMKQIILSAIAFSLIIVGYLNYSYEGQETIEVASDVNEVNIGDVQLVNSEPDNSELVFNSEENNKLEEAIVPNSEVTEKNDSNIEQIEFDVDNYFTETKLERDRMNSEMIDTYQKMLNSAEISNEQKSIATQEISKITNMKNGVMISENLIKNKGFQDVVILISNNNVSVVIKTVSLNQEQIAQIQNIVSRELNIDVGNINISNKY